MCDSYLWKIIENQNRILQRQAEAVEFYKKQHAPEWHLAKNELPDPDRLVWFYPPLLARRTGRWNDDKGWWSPDYGADNLGPRDSLIAWAYADEDELPRPDIKMEVIQ